MFYIQGQTVNDLGGYFRSMAGTIDGDLETLDGKVQQVLSQWEGSAQTAYHTAQADWTTKMTDLKTCLFNIGQRLEQIVTTYDDSDRRGANLF